jgi:hypothetical protein
MFKFIIQEKTIIISTNILTNTGSVFKKKIESNILEHSFSPLHSFDTEENIRDIIAILSQKNFPMTSTKFCSLFPFLSFYEFDDLIVSKLNDIRNLNLEPDIDPSFIYNIFSLRHISKKHGETIRELCETLITTYVSFSNNFEKVNTDLNKLEEQTTPSGGQQDDKYDKYMILYQISVSLFQKLYNNYYAVKNQCVGFQYNPFRA